MTNRPIKSNKYFTSRGKEVLGKMKKINPELDFEHGQAVMLNKILEKNPRVNVPLVLSLIEKEDFNLLLVIAEKRELSLLRAILIRYKNNFI